MPIDEFISSRKLVNLAFLVDSSMGQTILSSDLDKDGIPVYSATMDDSPFGYLNPSKNKIYLKNGDMVVPARGNSIGYVTLINDHEATCTQTTIALKMICTLVSKYIYYYFKAYQKILFEYVGGAIPQITLTMISNIVIPLPPLQEQQRIVAKLDELFALIDKIEKEQDELEEYKKLAKEKVLELAVTGKLVKQDPNDEPASVLLERRIMKEKEALVKAGKIKKDKVDNEPLSNDNKNYYQKLPKGWASVRLKMIAYVNMGQSPSGDTYGSDGMEFHQGKMMFANKAVGVSSTRTTNPIKIAEPGSILMSVRAPVGDINLCDRKLCIGRGLCSIKPYNPNLLDYLYLSLKSDKKYFENSSTGTTFKAINRETIERFVVGLPPESELRRIINKTRKLEELFHQII